MLIQNFWRAFCQRMDYRALSRRPMKSKQQTASRVRSLAWTAEVLESRYLLSTITVTSLADNVTVDNQVTLREALQAAKIPSQMHIFQEGGHGFSLHWTKGKPASAWPSLFLTWAAAHGFKA